MKALFRWLQKLFPKSELERDKERVSGLIQSGNIPKFDKNTQVEFLLGIDTKPVFSAFDVKILDYKHLKTVFDITRMELFELLKSGKYDKYLSLHNEQDGLWIKDRDNKILVEQERGQIINTFSFDSEELFYQKIMEYNCYNFKFCDEE